MNLFNREARAERSENGLLFFPKNPGNDLFSNNAWEFLAALLQLSRAETAVAKLLCEGRTRAQVAEEIGISVETVRTYNKRLCRKLQVDSTLKIALRLVRIHRQFLLAEQDEN